jgi:hypothetical protein
MAGAVPASSRTEPVARPAAIVAAVVLVADFRLFFLRKLGVVSRAAGYFS